MTEQELKGKIVEILDKNESKWLEVNEPLSGYGEPYIEIHCDKLAEVLIAADLTFDGEWKRRAEVAEKAARDLIAYYCGYTIENDIDSSLRVALQQAEKELQEEQQ